MDFYSELLMIISIILGYCITTSFVKMSSKLKKYEKIVFGISTIIIFSACNLLTTFNLF